MNQLVWNTKEKHLSQSNKWLQSGAMTLPCILSCSWLSITKCTSACLTEVKGDGVVLPQSPSLEYSGTVWVLAPLSGLLLLHPDGSIYSIRNHLALSLFGYNMDELLRKVSQRDHLNMTIWIDDECQLSILSLLVCHQQSVTFLMPGFYGWMSDSDRKSSSFSEFHAEATKSTASSKISKCGEHLYVQQCNPFQVHSLNPKVIKLWGEIVEGQKWRERQT